MDIIGSVKGMRETAGALRLAGNRLALVPTMGFLHEGHLELMRVGRRAADILMISIFVNPTQFGPQEDYARYPRDPKGDIEKARRVGVDIVFTPSSEEMYPKESGTIVHVQEITRRLCGISRPGHFDGVTTVVAKLFHITKPHVAVFGEKDYQQLVVVRRMVADLNMDIQIMGVPTYRESDGLAMSSRNMYLNSEERASALCLKKSLDLAQEKVAKGETDPEVLRRDITSLIMDHPFTAIDYVSLCHPLTLEEVGVLGDETILALAVRVGNTRLIDNCLLRRPFGSDKQIDIKHLINKSAPSGKESS